jgi:crotonobetainyl-CoA:carnitine CoA-transferase CaiB-like acyl-CoA transferase
MRYSSLADVRVLDLTHYVAGPYAAKLLADLGAEVIKVEPPWGEGGRRLGPYRDGSGTARGASPERGGLFAFLNLNKLGVTLNLKHERGRELLFGLLEGADLMVENFAPATLPALGLAPEKLTERFPRLSVISISNFGSYGPDRDALIDDLVLYARGGWTFAMGEPEREPLTPPGSLAQYVGALYGAIASLQALLARDFGDGRGQHVDISLLEATVSTMIYDMVTFQYTGVLRERCGRRYMKAPFLIATVRCRDGYVGLHCVTDKQFDALFEMMGMPKLARDPRFSNGLARLENNDAMLEVVEPFFASHDAAFLYREGQGRGIPLVPIPSVAQVMEWEQLNVRRYFETIEDPVLGTIRMPGAPLRLSSHAPVPSRPAPQLGEHNREVLGTRLGLSGADLERLRASGTI